MTHDGFMRYDATATHAIEATGLVKRFGTTTALDGGWHAAPPGDQRLERVTRVARRVVGPDVPGQRASRDDTPGVQGQQSEQDPQLAAADANRASRLIPHLQRAPQPDTQRVRHLPLADSHVQNQLPRGSPNPPLHPTLPSEQVLISTVGRKRREG